MPVTDVWGIAKRTAKRLEKLGIHTAWDLATSHPSEVRKHSNICIERTLHELNGTPCLSLDEVPPAKKQIYCTRSFGRKATTLPPILEALSLYAARATEKLRQQQYLAVALHVFMHTSPFEPHFHSASHVINLPFPTDDTRVITAAVRRLGTALYSKGHAFLKAGVGLVDIIDKRHYQLDLFHPGQSAKADKLMDVIDRINRLEGKGSLFLGAQGISKPWYMRQQYTSPQFTTKWSDIPIVKAH
jgi:DNA polymerase V